MCFKENEAGLCYVKLGCEGGCMCTLEKYRQGEFNNKDCQILGTDSFNLCHCLFFF